jgi:hypothetical protein
VHFTALTLELVIPLMEARSGTFLAGLEEALLQIMMSRGPSVSNTFDKFEKCASSRMSMLSRIVPCRHKCKAFL